MSFVQPSNDTVTVYVDGVQQRAATTIRSWEDYYLLDTADDPGHANPYRVPSTTSCFAPATSTRA